MYHYAGRNVHLMVKRLVNKVEDNNIKFLNAIS